MNLKLLVLSIVAIFLLAQAMFSFAGTVQARSETQRTPSTSITIFPYQNDKMQIGQTFTLNVTAENCANVYAFQVDIKYDLSSLKTLSVSPAKDSPFTLIVANTSNLFQEGLNLTYIGEPYGQVYYVAALPGTISGIYGEVPLFTITFEIVSYGSSAIQLVKYPGNGADIGTYFMDQNHNEIIPRIYNSNYGEAPTTQATPPSSTNTDTTNFGSIFLLPSLVPLAAAVLLVVSRKILRKRSNQ